MKDTRMSENVLSSQNAVHWFKAMKEEMINIEKIHARII